MDLTSKYRLIGASIWLGLLVLIVPQWYSNPVNFIPEGGVTVENKSTLPIVEHAYRLPDGTEQPLSDGQVEHLTHQNTLETNQNENTAQDEHPQEASNNSLQAQLTVKAQQIDDNKQYKGQWIVRLLAFKDIKEANDVLGQLDSEYDVYIKFYENTKVYSLRAGPYISKAKADKDKAKLDKILHSNGEVVQLP